MLSEGGKLSDIVFNPAVGTYRLQYGCCYDDVGSDSDSGSNGYSNGDGDSNGCGYVNFRCRYGYGINGNAYGYGKVNGCDCGNDNRDGNSFQFHF